MEHEDAERKLPHPFLVYINTAEHLHWNDHISFEHVVKVSGLPVTDEQQYSVTYSDGPHVNPDGMMAQGEKVKLKQKMIFDVSTTSRS